jgi:hypothetical protein
MPPRKRKAPLKAIVEAEEADLQEQPAAQEAAAASAQNEEDEEQIRLIIQEAKEQGAHWRAGAERQSVTAQCAEHALAA